MKIYHGVPTDEFLRKAREIAPSHEHYAEYPASRVGHTTDSRWILDNGAYGGNFEPQTFIEALTKSHRYNHGPDWVILPDVYQQGEASIRRSKRYADVVDAYGHDHYLPVQDGMRDVEQKVRTALDLGCSGVFIGGSDGFKREYAGQYVMTAHDYRLQAHIGRPGDGRTWRTPDAAGVCGHGGGHVGNRGARRGNHPANRRVGMTAPTTPIYRRDLR